MKPPVKPGMRHLRDRVMAEMSGCLKSAAVLEIHPGFRDPLCYNPLPPNPHDRSGKDQSLGECCRDGYPFVFPREPPSGDCRTTIRDSQDAALLGMPCVQHLHAAFSAGGLLSGSPRAAGRPQSWNESPSLRFAPAAPAGGGIMLLVVLLERLVPHVTARRGIARRSGALRDPSQQQYWHDGVQHDTRRTGALTPDFKGGSGFHAVFVMPAHPDRWPFHGRTAEIPRC